MDITNALFLLSKWDLQTRNFQRMVSSHLKLPESAFVFTEWCAIISNMVKPFSILQEMASSCLKVNMRISKNLNLVHVFICMDILYFHICRHAGYLTRISKCWYTQGLAAGQFNYRRKNCK